jgi:uncharacterized repeat protein (TIGR03806 family)
MAEDPAPLLSDYRLFTDAEALTPNARVLPYRLNTPLFTDYARKSRFLYLPPGTAARYQGSELLDLPVGAVLAKTFAYPERAGGALKPVETRLLIHQASGWKALTYVWDKDGANARLKRAGAALAIDSVDDKGRPISVDYRVPNVNACKTCHSIDGVFAPLGPKARNLNGPQDGIKGASNQLDAWSKAGFLTGAPAARVLARTSVWDDPAEPVERRARAYLDVNCSHCHNAKGFASNSGLFLGWNEADTARLGVRKRPVAAGRGSGGMAYAIEPGDPDHSILIYRMASTEPGVMMAPVGRSLVHEEGLALIRDYIARMRPLPQDATTR